MFLLVYAKRGDNAKRFNAQKYCLPKSIIKNDKILINGKNFYDQVIDSDIKPYEEIRKLTTGQGENYTTGCLIDYDYIKNLYIIIPIYLNRQKELDYDPKVIQQIKFVGQLKKLDANDDAADAGNDQSMYILTLLEKLKETRLKF